MPGTRPLTFMTALFAACASLIAATPARAHSEYVQYVPNGGLKACANCHPNGNESALNGFGDDTLPHVDKPPSEWWPLLAELDSDGDGQTNGEELGDPCYEWLIGLDPARDTDLSNPGDAASKAVAPSEPPCEGEGGSGGSTTTTTTAASTVTAGATTGAGGGGQGGGGQGGEAPSSGAGKADPQNSIQPGACAASPAPAGSSAVLSLLASMGLLLLARSRKSTSK